MKAESRGLGAASRVRKASLPVEMKQRLRGRGVPSRRKGWEEEEARALQVPRQVVGSWV